MKAKVTNNSKALQGVWTPEGLLQIEPGHSRTLVIKAGHEERTKRFPFLSVEVVGEVEPQQAAPPPADADNADLIGAMTDDELRALILRKTGKPAHHKAGHDRLLELAKAAAQPLSQRTE
ncbi:MAG: hypothetical protein ABW043_16665 [Devosia sp.]|uniref:hypothetical protein n=1 Tax=Devosia sp. TaxID=1871048 RepID=UPI00339160E3